MSHVFTPEDILPDGDDHTTAVNPFTGFKGRARKGTVAATLNNIALLNRLFLENAKEDQIINIKKAIVELIPSLKAVGIFDLFNPQEWINNEPKYLGRTYVVLLYLKHYPEEIDEEITKKLKEIKKTAQSPFVQSELQSL
jgi:ferredoxin-fold anticodon binding domain-containing protein